MYAKPKICSGFTIQIPKKLQNVNKQNPMIYKTFAKYILNWIQYKTKIFNVQTNIFCKYTHSEFVVY